MDPTNPQGQPSTAPETQPPQPTDPTNSQVLAAQFSPAGPGQMPPPVSSGKLPSAFSLFIPSQQALSRNLRALYGLILVPALLVDVWNLFFMSNNFRAQHAPILIVLGVVYLLYIIYIIAAVPYLQLKAAQGQIVGFMQAIKDSRPFFWRIIGLYIVMVVVITVGLVLFIVPGIIMIRRYLLANYFLIDRNLGIQEAMRQSAAATKGRSGAVWGIIGVEILLGGVNVIPIVGRFISTVIGAFYSSAPAIRYEQLKALDSQVAPPARPPLS